MSRGRRRRPGYRRSVDGIGRAYVFRRAGTEWRQGAKLAPDDGDGSDIFGGPVALTADGSTALLGAIDDEDPNGPNAGSAYLFIL